MKSLMIAGFSAFLMSLPALADDCWVTDKPTGWSAMSNQNYSFGESGHQNMIICFRENDGSVTGSDLQFIKFGESTLIGWGANGVGLEVVNVIQIDRTNRKLLFTQTRIGTATQMPILPDVAGAYTANIVPVTGH